jgi:hypothetical protein
MYGRGIYFADNSNYSSNYAHPVTNKRGQFQMFLALVLVGESVDLPSGQYNLPPNKPGSQTERYDSIHNKGAGHYIVYDNIKTYPGYLITYK